MARDYVTHDTLLLRTKIITLSKRGKATILRLMEETEDRSLTANHSKETVRRRRRHKHHSNTTIKAPSATSELFNQLGFISCCRLTLKNENKKSSFVT